MKKILVIGYVRPEPTSSAAGTRMLQLLEFFKEENYQITFATSARETDNKINLEAIDIQTEKIQINNPEFDELLERIMPDVVLFDRFMMEEQYGWRVDNICPKAIKILDTEDLHFLRRARKDAYKTNIEVEHIYFNSDYTKREIAAIYRCDLSLIISEAEIEILRSKFRIPEDILLYLPFLLDPISNPEQLKLPEFEDRKDFITIGNFLHEPNWNAVLYLKKNIWPLLRKKLPEARLNIYGAYPSQKVLDLNNPKENFLIHGWTEDSNKVMRDSRVCLAPIQFGAGLKGKLVEAMKNGTPSITSKIGSEGINDSDEWSGFIADDISQFINKSIELYSDRETWQESQKIGFEIYNRRFLKQEHLERFSKVLNVLSNDLNSQRDLNFTGKMLKHHLHKSTYYMSRFIEEKNRNQN